MKVPYALENVSKLCLVYNDVLVFKKENEWTPRTVTRIQDIVSHRIIQAHDTFQFKWEDEWTPRTVTRIQDIVSHRIIQAHDTFQHFDFQTVVLFDVVAVQKGGRVDPENGYTHSRHR
ncbi:hypothetical protein DPMN_052340 [Dreissena polymorpha]|uniref:Uncharacterized protein n=1 Tax=Dreissena polymorpha TaxID=45954 RepID=A0A9D4CLB8_DREPO|nr:hypothetical protein DPMN_052340 [Dreissena polymorpha]